MIIEELVLRNFGLYKGCQTVELTPQNSNRPITLIGGLNGGGKTTFLEFLCAVIGEKYYQEVTFFTEKRQASQGSPNSEVQSCRNKLLLIQKEYEEKQAKMNAFSDQLTEKVR